MDRHDFDLFDSLDDCDPQLDVGEVVEHVEPGDDVDDGEDQGDPDEDGDAKEDGKASLGHLLVAALEDKALEYFGWNNYLLKSGKPGRW